MRSQLCDQPCSERSHAVHPHLVYAPPPAHAARGAQCLGSGWCFPWGLRVRLCEVLLRGVFDTLEEGSYIGEADDYLQMLQVKGPGGMMV